MLNSEHIFTDYFTVEAFHINTKLRGYPKVSDQISICWDDAQLFAAISRANPIMQRIEEDTGIRKISKEGLRDKASQSRTYILKQV